MARIEIDFKVTDPNRIELPDRLLRDGGSYRIELRDGDVYVWGNQDGLRYLAEVLARLAVGGYAKTLHVHLPADSKQVGHPERAGEGPELIVFAADDE